MPEIMNPQRSDELGNDPVTARVQETRAGLATLLEEAEAARRQREESAGEGDPAKQGSAQDGSAVCAWNHFENIPTFYNWNNRPR
jgi:hypothetical protein